MRLEGEITRKNGSIKPLKKASNPNESRKNAL